MRAGKFLFFVVICICLAVSAFYELIEWWSALALGQGAHEFLGTQGDEWDTQWDMFLALVGAIAAQLCCRACTTARCARCGAESAAARCYNRAGLST